jgi:hypothetical protein
MFRVVAAVLLLLASADLAMPQFCEEDSAPLVPVAQTLGHAEGSPEPQSDHASAEDCFCCCSHIVSEELESPLGALALVNIPARTTPSDVPFAPLGFLFRPPRLA